MSAADVWTDLYRYNQWANAKVFAVCREQDPELLRREAPGTRDTIEGTLKHLVGVEDVYLMMLRDQPLDRREDMPQYFAHDLSWFADRAGQVAEGYRSLIPHLDDAALASPLRVPWFDFALTKRDGLLQVLSHSSQHRAQVFSVLGANGVEVPDLDYVLMVKAGL